MKKLEIILASMPDREKEVAEIWDGKQMIAEVNQENSDLDLEIYINGFALKVNYDIFLSALIEAKEKLRAKKL